MKQPPPTRATPAPASQAFQRALQSHQQGRLDQAERLYQAILATQPNHFDALHQFGILRYQQGRYAEALAHIGAALQARPADVAALSNFGLVCATCGHPEDALASYDKALALKPDLAQAHNNRGNALRDLKRHGEALASFERAVALAPDYAEAHNNRGNALVDLKRPEEALASYERALAARPGFAGPYNNRGNALRELGRSAEALASYERALALQPAYPEALNNRGNALRDLRRPLEALASYDKALALSPHYAEALANRGDALRDLKRPEEALASYDKALALKGAYPEALHNRGNALADLKRPEEALASYDRALALRPGYSQAYDSKGITLMELGRLREAGEAIEQAIALDPERGRFFFLLALSRRLAPGDPAIPAMEQLARRTPPLAAEEQVYLNFALGKAHADIGDAERSFQLLREANALKRARTIYDEAATLGVLERTRAAFTPERMAAAAGRGEPSPVPVFILGMPRSGSTLIEQILASHPQAFGAGEIVDFDKAIAGLGGAEAEALHRPEVAAAMSGESLRRLGAAYVERLRAASPAAARIANKTTENFRLAGLIHLALPNARIIHSRREPIDVCLSCFSTLFAENLPYAYDLEELARYYRAYETLMAHWRGVLPQEAMIEVQYEEVVADLEGQARRIIAHCGLEWDPRCLDFHQTQRPVRSASLTQVRQPIYQSSLARWRAVEPFVADCGPAFAALIPREEAAPAPPSATLAA